MNDGRNNIYSGEYGNGDVASLVSDVDKYIVIRKLLDLIFVMLLKYLRRTCLS